jgi:hypothetical protein
MMVLIGDYTAVIDGRRFDDIRTYTLGIMFFGTPHRGSESTAFPMTLGNVANIALSRTSRYTGKIRTDLIDMLKKDSDFLKRISTNFRNQLGKLKLSSFIEQDITPPSSVRVCSTRPSSHRPFLNCLPDCR